MNDHFVVVDREIHQALRLIVILDVECRKFCVRRESQPRLHTIVVGDLGSNCLSPAAPIIRVSSAMGILIGAREFQIRALLQLLGRLARLVLGVNEPQGIDQLLSIRIGSIGRGAVVKLIDAPIGDDRNVGRHLLGQRL